ncbi:DUF2283 domain-containing protein [Sphingomonas sp.]|uniref:DUF2283 domain-containing protein n=1 Tax=Sphingomonas sp. TaxID=28214 RepID=UPI002D8076A0|nr:DUF2283 domain-containing protein [Sphingomonas sp.]HEU0045124.1 DUF2283 domain-containing protein [Sphingomonas sp.]
MKLHYYPETDSLYIELSTAPSIATQAISDSVNVDFDQQGGIVGIDIGHASKQLDLTTLETSALPIQALRAA